MKSTINKFILLLFLFVQIPASAQISPGKLSSFHVSLEGIGNCTSCHEIGKEPTNDRCLKCHGIIQAHMDASRGYHSANEVRSKKCAQCHSEHHGREFQLVFWKDGRDKFDHALTGYSLEGKHQGLGCDKCHREEFYIATEFAGYDNINAKRTYFGLNPACINCHVDEHRDQLNDDCLQCHNYQGWRPATGFSHDKTQYRLTGKHRDLACAKCHLLQAVPAGANPKKIGKKQDKGLYAKYSNLNFANCTPCHRDVHNGKFGIECQKCHVTGNFKDIQGQGFDHNLTDFPLKGAHAGVLCNKCHVPGDMMAHIPHSACRDCHQDTHRGQFAARPDSGACEQCHTVQGFLPSTFDVTDHQVSTYPLTGSHLAVPCNLCHIIVADAEGATYTQFQFPDTKCQTCHKDIHHGQTDRWTAERGCEFCHSTDSWHSMTFDHTLSRFKLDGKHSEVGCRKCHVIVLPVTNEEEILLQPISTQCYDCHDNVHGGQFAQNDITQCSHCHTPQGWKSLIFDHNRDSRFPLHGAHQKVSCDKCHRTTTLENGKQVIHYKPISFDCIDCHGNSVPKLPEELPQ
jgi:hypothetical protein